MSSLRMVNALFLIMLAMFLALIVYPAMTLQMAEGQTDQKNVLLIGWDGVQRNHLFELLDRNLLPNLASFIDQGTIVNITVTDHGIDTKAGWTQILTGYRWWRTGVYNNVYWFHGIPGSYTIPERVESYFGKSQVITGFRVGKLFHMEITDGTGDAANGRYTNQALYRNLAANLDVVDNGDRNASTMGSIALTFLQNRANNHFFAFIHFSDPDTAGHMSGENSVQYENAIEACDYQLGQILEKLNNLTLTQKTLVYVTADHGFDEGGYAHNNAPYVFLATNDKNVTRNGDQVDVAPTLYYGIGMWGQAFDPQLDGYPLQVSLPQNVEEARQRVLTDLTQPTKATITSPNNGVSISGTVNVSFNASDRYLSAVLLLINNTLVADGPWTWLNGDSVVTNGSYSWDTTSIAAGAYTITVLSFDEHGSNNAPSTTTVTVNKASTTQATRTMTPTTPSPTQTPRVTPKNTLTPSLAPTSTPASTSTLSAPPSPTNLQEAAIGKGALYGIAIAVAAIALVAIGVGVRKQLKK